MEIRIHIGKQGGNQISRWLKMMTALRFDQLTFASHEDITNLRTCLICRWVKGIWKKEYSKDSCAKCWSSQRLHEEWQLLDWYKCSCKQAEIWICWEGSTYKIKLGSEASSKTKLEITATIFKCGSEFRRGHSYWKWFWGISSQRVKQCDDIFSEFSIGIRCDIHHCQQEEL